MSDHIDARDLPFTSFKERAPIRVRNALNKPKNQRYLKDVRTIGDFLAFAEGDGFQRLWGFGGATLFLVREGLRKEFNIDPPLGRLCQEKIRSYERALSRRVPRD
jgi:hypothetical protein